LELLYFSLNLSPARTLMHKRGHVIVAAFYCCCCNLAIIHLRALGPSNKRHAAQPAGNRGAVVMMLAC
jgi:hypothetical protein